MWARGILTDEYGFRPERNRWVIGGLRGAHLGIPRPDPTAPPASERLRVAYHDATAVHAAR